MTRINVPNPDGSLGWFDADKAERWSDEDYEHNGSGGTGRGQAVYRTAQGRWVLENWTFWQGEPDSHGYIGDDEAREWLLRNDEDNAVAKYFGPIEEERGPGRPEIGGAAHIRYGEERLARVDAYAELHGLSRPDAIRQLIDHALLVITGTAS